MERIVKYNLVCCVQRLRPLSSLVKVLSVCYTDHGHIITQKQSRWINKTNSYSMIIVCLG